MNRPGAGCMLRIEPMPVARSKADIMCLAVYTLAGGKVLRGFMVSTIADRLRISFEQAEDMAVAAAEAGLIRHEFPHRYADGRRRSSRGYPDSPRGQEVGPPPPISDTVSPSSQASAWPARMKTFACQSRASTAG
jgi:hypothetical protein